MMIFRPQGLAAQPPAGGRAGRGHAATAALRRRVAEHARRRRRTPWPRPAPAVLDVDPPTSTLPDDFVARADNEAPADEVLRLDRVTMRFGGVTALDGVSLDGPTRGEIFGIIGPNGAGKTTVFNCVTGVFRPTDGDIVLEDARCSARQPHAITERGHRPHVPEHPPVPEHDRPRERHGRHRRPPHHERARARCVGMPKRNREEELGRAEALRLLEFVGIAHRAEEAARNLPYGDQRRLEIARALATQPTVLLLDEPAAGFNPAEKQALVVLIRQIRDAA